MTGRVEQIIPRVVAREHRLLGKNGDAAVTFERIGIQKGIAVIDSAELLQVAGAIEQRLRQGGFAGVHMRQNADCGLFHDMPSPVAKCFFCQHYNIKNHFCKCEIACINKLSCISRPERRMMNTGVFGRSICYD